MKRYIQLFLVTIISFGLQAQGYESNLTQDSIKVGDTEFEPVSTKDKGGYFDMFEGTPGKAALFSAIVPGLGQIYNRRYWKPPIIWAVEGGLGYSIYYYHDLSKQYDIGYKAVLRNEATSFAGHSNPQSLKSIRDRFRKFRDYSIIGLAVAHVINIADAFVDRHLIEFDIDDDLSIGLPKYGAGIALIYHIN